MSLKFGSESIRKRIKQMRHRLTIHEIERPGPQPFRLGEWRERGVYQSTDGATEGNGTAISLMGSDSKENLATESHESSAPPSPLVREISGACLPARGPLALRRVSVKPKSSPEMNGGSKIHKTVDISMTSEPASNGSPLTKQASKAIVPWSNGNANGANGTVNGNANGVNGNVVNGKPANGKDADEKVVNGNGPSANGVNGNGHNGNDKNHSTGTFKIRYRNIRSEIKERKTLDGKTLRNSVGFIGAQDDIVFDPKMLLNEGRTSDDLNGVEGTGIDPTANLSNLSVANSSSDRSSFVDQKTVFRTWSEKELDSQRRVIEKYESGKKLWTKDSLRSVEHQIKNENPVMISPYVGKGRPFDREKGVTYRVEFHGYYDLAFPPASRPDGEPYSPMSLKTIPIDYSRVKEPGNGESTFDHYANLWLANPVGQQFMALFMRVPLPPYINKIVAVDLGPITVRSAKHNSDVRHAIYKHAAVMTMVEALHRRFKSKIQLIAQDVHYCDECTRVLFKKGFSVVGQHGALAFPEVDDKTLVFAPNAAFCVKEIVADLAEPAAMFWNTVLSPEESERVSMSERPLHFEGKISSFYHKHVRDPDTPRVRALVAHYDKHSFPMNNLFGSASLYARNGMCVSDRPTNGQSGINSGPF